MKKAGVLFSTLLFAVLLSAFALAATNQTTDEKAYSCLESRVSGKCSSLPFEDQLFSLLALAYDSAILNDCKSAIGSSRECWPVENCKLRETAIAMLALGQTGNDITKIKDWLLSKSRSPDKLLWYLQIDTKSNATCKINYEDKDYNAKISADKKLAISSNRCLKSADYWLTIDKACFEETFKVTCDADFVSSLLYKTSTSSTFFVSGVVESASAGGTTQHKVESKCFAEGTSGCNYEGSLWAAFALLKTQNKIDAYLPYLFAFAEENTKFSPYSFLYTFIGEDEYRQKLINSQKKEGYWEFGSGKGKFYDTSAALMAFQTQAEYGDVTDKIKTYLSGTSIQPSSGCWGNSVKDTAFLLWTLWPKPIPFQTTQQSCEGSGFFCMAEGECSSSGGNLKSGYYCPGGILKVCCDKPLALKPCSEQLGVECPSDQRCSSSVVRASDTSSCCLATCESAAEATECESAGYFCRVSCLGDEEELPAYTCNVGDVCCKQAEEKGGILIWIVLLVFLIALTVIGIKFRHRLKPWFYAIKNKFKRGPAAPAAVAGKPRPPFPPYPAQQRAMPQPARAAARPVSRELEETLKKLKEMGK